MESTMQIRTHVRWMIRADMREVIAIENACFQFPWAEEDFVHCLRQRNCIGMVAEHEEKVLGYVVYELRKSSLTLHNFAVKPECMRHGVGKQLVEKLKNKLSAQRRSMIEVHVRETNVAAQLFFRSQGFEAVRICKWFYTDTVEDAYLFRYRWAFQKFHPVNRITGVQD